MFVGETGIARTRAHLSADEAGRLLGDVRKLGGIDIPTIQKHLNLWLSLSLDHHGSGVEQRCFVSSPTGSRVARRGTFGRARRQGLVLRMEFFEDGKPVTKEILMRNAMNEVLRDWYVGDCAAGVVRWNRILEQHGLS